MIHRIFTLAIFFFSVISLHAQHQWDNWYFGHHAGINFSGKDPKPLLDGKTNGPGTAVISDPKTGQLLFYTDGVTVWNRNHDMMLNGNGLKGVGPFDKLYKDDHASVIIMPKPYDKNKYYIFTTNGLWADQLGIFYSVVDIALDNSLGAVVEKNIFLQKDQNEILAATKASNPNEFWLVTFQLNQFFAFKIDKSGILPDAVVSTISNTGLNAGQIKFSPNRKKLALERYQSDVAIFDFDANTGIISNEITVDVGSKYDKYFHGVAFSPDSRFLYVSWSIPPNIDSIGIDQYDLQATDIVRSKAEIVKFWRPLRTIRLFGQPKLAPDGKIYVATIGGKLSVINSPNKKGKACEYLDTIVDLGGRACRYALPFTIDDEEYFLPPIAAFSGNKEIFCQNEIIFLKDTSSGRIDNRQWIINGDDYEEKFSEKEFSFLLPKPGTYKITLIVSNSFGADTAEKFVKVFPPPPAYAGEDAKICSGGAVLLGRAPEKNFLYSWSPKEEFSDNSVANPIVKPKKKTEYILNVTDPETGCVNSDTVVIDVGRLEIKISSDAEICSGDTIPLFAYGGEKFSWFPVESLSDAAIANPFAFPKQTTTYKVVARSGECTDSAFVTVTVNEKPRAFAGKNSVICPGGRVQLGEYVKNNFSYKWMPAVGLDRSDVPNPIATPLQTTTYFLTVTNSKNCSAIDSVTITVGEKLVATVSNDVEICAGEKILLEAGGGSEYRWFTKENSFLSDESKIFVSPEKSTKYFVLISQNYCSELDSVLVSVKEKSSISAGEDREICAGEKISLHASGEKILQWRWSHEEFLDDPASLNPTIYPEQTTDFILAGLNQNNCWSYDTVHVEVAESDVLRFELSAHEKNIYPGDAVKFTLKVSSGKRKFSEFKTKIFFDEGAFHFEKNSFRKISSNDWRFTQQSLDGEIFLSGFGEALEYFECELVFTGLLSAAEPKKFSLLPESSDECYKIISEGPEIDYANYCGRNIRAVSIAGSKFEMQAPGFDQREDELIIKYSLGYGCPVRISIVNILGEEIFSKDTEGRQAGSFEETISVRELSPGTYFLILHAGEYAKALCFRRLKR